MNQVCPYETRRINRPLTFFEVINVSFLRCQFIHKQKCKYYSVHNQVNAFRFDIQLFIFTTTQCRYVMWSPIVHGPYASQQEVSIIRRYSLNITFYVACSDVLLKQQLTLTTLYLQFECKLRLKRSFIFVTNKQNISCEA